MLLLENGGERMNIHYLRHFQTIGMVEYLLLFCLHHVYFLYSDRYYKSGAEIFRQANNYYDDESLENAYLLYHKYLSLFIEKVDKHPEFPTVPKEDKVRVKSTLLKVLKRCEEIKARLKEIYR